VLVGDSILNPKKGLLTASVNVNGLRSHLGEIKVLVKSIGIDLLALSETQLRQSTKQQLTEITVGP